MINFWSFNVICPMNNSFGFFYKEVHNSVFYKYDAQKLLMGTYILRFLTSSLSMLMYSLKS